MTTLEFADLLFLNYETWKENSFKDRFINHELIKKLILKKNNFQTEVYGYSTLGREVYLLKFGTGKIKIFLWSQMHGDEPTATMAIFDILNYLTQTSSEVKNISELVTIYFMPMVNPDGAEIFTRRNIFGIDLNRDFVNSVATESKILKGAQEKLKPNFGFNLHDQDPRYTVGKQGEVSTIALLAPSVDEKKSVTVGWENAKMVASKFAEVMKKFIPKNLSRYSDDFEPRAFGDNFQKSGMATVLVESGGFPNDENKFFIRKLNFVGILSTIYSIASGEYLNSNLNDYEKLPENEKYLYDFILREIKLKFNGVEITTDIGFNFEDKFRETVRVMEIGDLKNFKAFQNINGNGKIISAEKIKWDIVLKYEEMKELVGL